MEFRRGRYSWLLRPLLITIDIAVINVFSIYFLDFNGGSLYLFSIEIFNSKQVIYFIYSLAFWLISTYAINFYRVFRYTSPYNILSVLIKQFIIYTILVFAFFGFFRYNNVEGNMVTKYLIYTFLVIGLVKISSYYILKSFRSYFKGNLRHVIIIGSGKGAMELKKLFKRRKGLGYNLKAVFNNSKDNNVNGTIEESFEYIKQNHKIDEIYCAIDELTEKQINEYVKQASLNRFNIKFVPNTNLNLITKRLNTNYYNYLPVLSIPEIPLNTNFNRLLKRTFDIIFSLFVIICILSWLSIILFILIKIESKGPLFYRQLRNGINYKEFYCYKYRSLYTNKALERGYIKQNDNRVTKIGRFLRRTSLDELPQFVNVLKGDMSVVGPRPHMLSYTDDYAKVIDKYNFIYRHNVKPGITGLAQIKGFRGEVTTDQDIINRIKYDIFYIENWSLLADISIIFRTLITIIKGDEKAY